MTRVPVQLGDRSATATVVHDGRRAWVHLAGRVFVIEPDEPLARRGGGAADQDALSAPMPATVVRVDVAAGDTVRTGDLIALLEAMKMELPIRAPRDGIIARVNCKAGDLIQPGEPLIDLK
jgi:biotin carboxyl carrier protein